MARRTLPIFWTTVLLSLLVSLLALGWRPSYADSAIPDEPCPTLDLSNPDGRPIPCWKLAARHYTSEPVLPSATGGPDDFGYRWDDSLTSYSWKDARGGTQVFPDPGLPGQGVIDDVFGPVNIGFNFKYYEETYSQVYIGDNGLIGFNNSIAGDSSSATNLLIPLDYEHPQNFIAPFWTDLWIGGNYNDGKVYYTTGTDEHGSFFAVEWYQVDSIQIAGLLTFEVVLYQDGTIVFQYESLTNPPDNLTVGIEDAEGVDGLLYLYNSPGLASGKDIVFTRPPDAPRLKAYPEYQSAFNINRHSYFRFEVRNTSETIADTYDLKPSSSASGWGVALYGSDGMTPLPNTDGDSWKDTGVLAPGQTFTIVAKVTAPSDAAVTAHTTITVDIVSNGAGNPSRTVEMNSVIPAPFAQIYYQSGSGINVEVVAPQVQVAGLVDEFYTGDTFAFNYASNGNYVSLWEKNKYSLYTDLEYKLVDDSGVVLHEQGQLLTDHAGTTQEVRDIQPVLVSAPDGTIGVAWIRTQSTTQGSNQNIYFAILDQNAAQFVLDEVQVTSNDLWYQVGDPEKMEYESLAIAASVSGTGESVFHLSWIERHTQGAVTERDVAHAVYRASTVPLKVATLMTVPTTPPDAVNYSGTALVDVIAQGNQRRVILLYAVNDTSDPGNPVNRLVYVLLDGSGGVVQAQTELYQRNAGGMDGIQLSNGGITLTWTDLTEGKVNYAILGQDFSKPAQPAVLENPDGRAAGVVSVTRDANGGAILTWMDVDWYQRLYYALVNAGGVLTQPMIFKYAPSGGAYKLETRAALGNAVYNEPKWRIFLSYIVR